MLTLKRVAVTGGLSSGKTTVCRFFKDLGAYVVSADEIVHQLLSPKSPLEKQVIALFGEEIVTDGVIDRSKIAKEVFSNPKLLKSLEELLHPAVGLEIQRQYQKALASGLYPLFVAEIPLLFETESDAEYDYTICVLSSKEEAEKRFASQGNKNEKLEFQKRMARQLTQEQKSAKANFVIQNNGSLASLLEAVTKIYHQLNPSI